MANIHCDVCNEPWDKYGLKHGDVKAWEADSILEGYGCPCCEANGFEPSELYDAISIREYTQIKTCDDCSDGFSIETEELHYDGSQKAFYHNSGTIHIDDEKEVERFLVIEWDWLVVDDRLVCKSCAKDYSKCKYCGGTFNEDDTVWVSEDQITCCQECQSIVSYEEMKSFDDANYCEFCYKKLITECEICKKEFLKKDLIEGMNGECCCSEECADKTTEEV